MNYFLVDVSLTNNFDLNLGSSLRHYYRASQKLQLLTKKAVELKLNNQVRYSYNILTYYIITLLIDIQSYENQIKWNPFNKSFFKWFLKF